MSKKKALTSIKSGTFSRGFALARLSVSAGAKAAGHAIGNFFGEEDQKEARFRQMLLSQVESLASELGQLKGSLMKVGQMLSVFGEHVLPPEVNAVLKSLQNQSPPLEWPAIEKALKRQLKEKLALLEVQTAPHASASLGQVHRARIIASGQQLALKVQYPGVDQSIESDVQAMKRLLSLWKLIPRGPSLDELFKEVRSMLRKEVDYRNELQETDDYRERISGDFRFVVPQTFPEFSTGRVLATSFEEGVAVDSPEVRALSQERRNGLGRAMLELYFRELFEFARVQTDPHFGNYRIRLSEKPGEVDRLVLLDFGAMREIPKAFLGPYRTMVRGSFRQDVAEVIRGSVGMGFLESTDPEELTRAFADLCMGITEPFLRNEPYDFGASDLPKRIMQRGGEIAFKFRLRPPPRELIFLDRKMAGVFTFMSVLKVKIDARSVLEPHLVDA